MALLTRHLDLRDAHDAAVAASLRYQWRAIERGENQMDEASFTSALAIWMSEHASTHHCVVVERDGVALAMGWLAVIDRVPGPGGFVRRSGFLQSVYVLANERNEGVGTVLGRELIELARSLGLDYIGVHPSERSFPFYRRLGFSDRDNVLELDLVERGPRLVP